MRLIGQLLLAQALVAELARLRVLVHAAVLELARLRVLEQAAVLELALELQLEREPPLVRMQGREPARQQELAAALEQAQKLRVSRQQELQQHRLPTAAQEQLPYLPALPMKAPCWGAPAW